MRVKKEYLEEGESREKSEKKAEVVSAGASGRNRV